ncbi:MAG: ATP:cob(I)alamin adenosyltransferase [Verrucomicrobia bacterium]|nr:ATP:cob(I)alamin adenosyltransferase [Verrucomicrobiota bacterium]
MYNRRVSKCHPRVEAYGTVDELNAALGLARAMVSLEPVHGWVVELQKHLVTLMGELATDDSDSPSWGNWQPTIRTCKGMCGMAILG